MYSFYCRMYCCSSFLVFLKHTYFFTRAGAGAGQKKTRSQSKMDRLRNTEYGIADKTLFNLDPDPEGKQTFRTFFEEISNKSFKNVMKNLILKIHFSIPSRSSLQISTLFPIFLPPRSRSQRSL